MKLNPHYHKNILVTGGAGYIGSHTCVELLQAGFNVVVVALDRFEQNAGVGIFNVGTGQGYISLWFDIKCQMY